MIFVPINCEQPFTGYAVEKLVVRESIRSDAGMLVYQRADVYEVKWVIREFICIYQEKLWLKQHYRWLEMLKQFYYDFHIYGKLMRRKYVILLGMSLLGSGIWQWLSMIFEW